MLTYQPKYGGAQRQLAATTESLWTKRIACGSTTMLLILANNSDRCSVNEYQCLIIQS